MVRVFFMSRKVVEGGFPLSLFRMIDLVPKLLRNVVKHLLESGTYPDLPERRPGGGAIQIALPCVCLRPLVGFCDSYS